MAHYDYDDVKSNIMRILRKKETVTKDMIVNEIRVVMDAFRAANLVEDLDEDALFRDISTHISVWQPDPSVLRDKKHINWLPEYKSKIDWNFWRRYQEYLEEEKDWSRNVTGKLDSTTDNILGDLGNPFQDGSWDRRGMVVGDVQSGKTANYTGLICKATDAGYKLIVVLAGMTNDLRSQTQSRLDAEFLGFESELGKLNENGSRIGVGKLQDHGQLFAQPLTYSAKDGDFRAKKGTNIKLGGNSLLLVVKKNKSVLERIIKWVESQGVTHPETGKKIVKDIPLLLLDDEADNASVNTNPDEDDDPTSINKAIRKILNVFSQSSYVGYTATPFANIFILPDEERADPSEYGLDLFPRNFIYYINPPNNYVGAKQVFGLPNDVDDYDEDNLQLPLIREANDGNLVFPSRHRTDLRVPNLPESLIKAIHTFILSCAARRVRGQKEVHNSMLIHVTRFNLVQEKVIELVSTELVNIQRMLDYKTGKLARELLFDLEKLWKKDFVDTTEVLLKEIDDESLTSIAWHDVENELLEAASKIEVRGINGMAGGQLDYDDHPRGLNVIAVGGDKLSRGLTLESLTVSYYLRPARNYDTLLQMGRWFGYRPGYLDLCRLFTTDEIVGWYQHISVATEELKREFSLMELSHLTPEEYGLKVRTHPDGLNITAANKIRNGTRLQVAFSGQLSQTTVFQKDNYIQNRNFEHTDAWLKKLGLRNTKLSSDNRFVWSGVSSDLVKLFLKDFRTHPACRKAETDLLIKYIEKLNEYDELKDWTVALISNTAAQNSYMLGPQNVGLIKRSDSTQHTDLYMLPNSNLLSPNDQMLDLDKDQTRQALKETQDAWAQGKSRAKNKPQTPSGPFIRKARPKERGLLLIYPLDNTSVLLEDNSFTDKPIIGFAVSFPVGSRDEKVEYQVNTKYWSDRYGEDEDDA